ncbi:MAG: sugar ABC transporter substrate-binding protein [Actinomycetota bacterium]
MRKTKKALVVLPLVAMTLLSACGDDGGDSTADTTATEETTAPADTTATAETTAPADTAAPAASDPSKGDIPEGGAEVTIAGDVTTWSGKKVGIANLAPVPGAERWSKPLQACIEKNGGTVDYQDVGGDPTKLPALLEGWASAKVDAVFNIGIDMTGQESLIAAFTEAKTPVVTWGAGNPEGVVALDANQEEDGRIIGRYLVEKVGSGQVILVNANNPALQSREKGLKEALDAAGMELVVVGEALGFSAESAQKSVEAALQANPDAKAVVGGFGSLGVGAAAAVTAAGSSAVVVSMNGDPEEYDAIRAGGPFVATVADGHEFGGEAACQIAADMIAGNAAPGTAGKQILATSVLVTADNVPAAGASEATPRKFYQLP